MPVKTPIGINITGKGVLIKQVPATDEINESNFSQIIPNGNLGDFYIQNFVSGEISFVSILRRSEADRIITLFTELGYQVLSLSLGPFVIDQIIPQLNNYGGELIFNGHTILFNEHQHWLKHTYLADTPPSSFQVKIDSELIDEKLIIPYAAAFQLILSTKLRLINAENPGLNEALKSVLSVIKVKAQGVAVLAVTFFLLLVNLILFSTLTSANHTLQNQLGRSHQSSADLELVNSNLKSKEANLKAIGWSSAGNESLFIESLAKILPKQLLWQELTVNPIDAEISKVTQETKYVSNRIRVMGASENISPVGEWVERIKLQPWVKSVQIERYNYDQQQHTGQFTVLIDY